MAKYVSQKLIPLTNSVNGARNRSANQAADRRAANEGAAFTAARTGPVPHIHSGDAAQHLPALLEQAPDEAVVCVYHTAVTAHFNPKARTEHCELLRELSKVRRILWLRAEPGQEPRLRFTDLDSGHSRTEVVLGNYHPHGAWLEWHHQG